MGAPLSAAELMRYARFDEDARNLTKGVLCRAEDFDELRTLSARTFARVKNAHPRNSKASCQSPPWPKLGVALPQPTRLGAGQKGNSADIPVTCNCTPSSITS